MFELLAVGTLLLFGLLVVGLVGGLLKLVFWLLFLPFRLALKLLALPFMALGLLLKLVFGVLLLPLFLVLGVIALVGFGLVALLGLLRAYPAAADRGPGGVGPRESLLTPRRRYARLTGAGARTRFPARTRRPRAGSTLRRTAGR